MTTRRELLGVYLRGLCMGAADAVPGVSGGTIALITGIYERLLAAITALEPARLWRLLGGLRSARRADAVTAFEEIDGAFLLALGAGIATAVVSVLRLLSVLLETNPVETYGFFFGLIGASALVLASEVSLSSRRRQATALVGVTVAFVVSGYAAAALESSLLVVFLSGVLAVSAMLLPGVSGSLLLLMVGQYAYLTNTLRRLTDGIGAALKGEGFADVFAAGPPVVVFLAGAVVGLLSVAHAVRWALARYRKATLVFLVSLVVGALRAPVVQAGLALEASGGSWSSETLGLFAASALVGALAVVVIDRLAGGIEPTQSA